MGWAPTHQTSQHHGRNEARLRHVREFDAAVRAVDARRARVQKGLMLKEIEMPPFLDLGVVDAAIGLGAGRTREAAAARKVQMDVEAFFDGVEGDACDLPRWRQAEGELEQGGVAHRVLSHSQIRLAASVPSLRAALKDKPFGRP